MKKIEEVIADFIPNGHLLMASKTQEIKNAMEYWALLNKNNVSEWQLCPKCNGEGIISNYPATTTNVTRQCDVCNGAKILAKPLIDNPILQPM